LVGPALLAADARALYCGSVADGLPWKYPVFVKAWPIRADPAGFPLAAIKEPWDSQGNAPRAIAVMAAG
jgi:hypothetical protein